MGDTLKLRLLTSDQVSTMREKCLYLLATLGMRIDHDGALALLAEAGADVDRETHVVKFPADLVEAALATVPRELVVKGADPSHAVLRVVPDHRDPRPRGHLRHPDADGRARRERRGPRAQHPDAEHHQAPVDARLQP